MTIGFSVILSWFFRYRDWFTDQFKCLTIDEFHSSTQHDLQHMTVSDSDHTFLEIIGLQL
jgi:hypothetical protein